LLKGNLAEEVNVNKQQSGVQLRCSRSAYLRIIEDCALYCLLPDPNEGFVEQIESSASSRGNILNWRVRSPAIPKTPANPHSQTYGSHI
jgi:hypothetical protein